MQERHSGKRGQNIAYRLNVTEHAEELLDNLVYHLIYRLKSEQAARHLLDGMTVYMTGRRIIHSSSLTAGIHIWQRRGIMKLLFRR